MLWVDLVRYRLLMVDIWIDIIGAWTDVTAFILLLVKNENSRCQFLIYPSSRFFWNWWNAAYFYFWLSTWFLNLISLPAFVDQSYSYTQCTFLYFLYAIVVVVSGPWIIGLPFAESFLPGKRRNQRVCIGIIEGAFLGIVAGWRIEVVDLVKILLGFGKHR